MTEAHKFHPSILREYDIRGIVEDTLTAEDAWAVGRAFGTVLKRRGAETVCVGRDGRDSSELFESRLVEGLQACGLSVIRVGLGPSPMLYFAVHTLGADGGVMVTGSHNPSDYNGFKMMPGPDLPGPATFYGAEIQSLGQMAADGDFETGTGRVQEQSVQDAYVEALVEEAGDVSGLSVGWDAGNGSAGEVLEQVVKRLGGQHHTLYTEIDGSFPNHHPDPTVEKNLEDLKTIVLDQKLDLGLAFDGDGDRIGAVDRQGRVLWADQLMVLYARDVLSRHVGASIIADVKASQLLFDEIEEAGGVGEMYKTGHSLIKSRMKELNAPLAGEMSGHIFFADRYYGFDDGLYAAMRLLRILSEGGESLDGFLDALSPMVNTPELRFDCPAERKAEVITEVKNRLQLAGADVNEIDGVRVTTEDGWWLLRASNTQDVLVARCEGGTQRALERLLDQLKSELAASGLSLPDGI